MPEPEPVEELSNVEPSVEPDLHTRIDRLEATIVDHLSPIELETIHHFAPGLYARELRIPAGVMLTGKIHRTRHLNVVSKGIIAVWSESTGPMLVCAPATFVSEPGTRRIGFAYEDTTWTTFHPTDETDLDRLETLLIEPRPVAAIEVNDQDRTAIERMISDLVSGVGDVDDVDDVDRVGRLESTL